MRRSQSFIFLFLTTLYTAYCNANDTIVLDEVIVTGSIPEVNLRDLSMSITVVSKNQIDARKDHSLLLLLTEEVPGLFITQRGVMGCGVAKGAAGAMSRLKRALYC